MPSEEAAIATTVMLVEDNRLLRETLSYVVQQEPDLELVGIAADGTEALTVGVRAKPRVVLLDIKLPDRSGIDVAVDLCRLLPDVRVVILSAFCTRRLVHSAFSAGACGYLEKDGSHRHLVDAIRSAADGGRPITPLAGRLFGEGPLQGSPKPAPAP